MSHPSREWVDRAVCAGQQLEVFFAPDQERGPSRARREAHAKTFCARCPVVADCLEYALAIEFKSGGYGVWGGTAEHQRRPLHDLAGRTS